MIRSVEDYLKQKTENISFVELKEDIFLNNKGLKLKSNIPLPLVIDDLVSGIKQGTVQEEIKISAIVRGIIYLLGIDPEFKYSQEYKQILFKYNEKIQDYIFLKGLEYAKNNNFEDSLVYMSASVNINNKDVRAVYGYGVGLEEIAKRFYKNSKSKEASIFINKAAECFEDVIDLDSEYSMAYYKLGFYYLNNKQYKKAQITWEKYIELETNNEDGIEEIKLNLIKIKDDVTYEEGYNEILAGKASSGLEKLLPLKEKYSDWWNLIFMIGLGYRQLGKYIEAKTQFENVLAIKPTQADAINELGLCLACLGKYQKAIEKFTEAIKIRPRDYEIICNRGMTYLQMGQNQKAKKDIEQAYKINPNDRVTISCKNKIESIIDRE